MADSRLHQSLEEEDEEPRPVGEEQPPTEQSSSSGDAEEDGDLTALIAAIKLEHAKLMEANGSEDLGATDTGPGRPLSEPVESSATVGATSLIGGADDPPAIKASTRESIREAAVTAAACRNDVIALGLANGTVLLLDAETYKTVGRFNMNGSIVDLCFDRTGTVLAVSDVQERISVRQLSRKSNVQFTTEEKHSAVFSLSSLPILIALDPECLTYGDYAFVCGIGSEGKVMITQRTWLFSSTTNEIAATAYMDSSKVMKLTWRGDIVAWNTRNGMLRLRDVRRSTWVSISHDDAFGREPVQSHFWETDENLFVTFQERIRVVRVRRASPTMRIPRTAVVLLTIDTTVLPIYVMPFGGRNGTILVVGSDGLARLMDRMEKTVFCTLWLVSTESKSSVYPGALFLYDEYWANSTQNLDDARDRENVLVKKTIVQETGLPMLYVLHNVVTSMGEARSDIVVVQSRVEEDLLQHALRNDDFEKALQIVKSEHGKQFCSLSEHDVADAYMMYLVKNNLYERLGDVMPRIVPQSDIELWFKIASVLANREQLHVVAHSIPVPGFPLSYYSLALKQSLAQNGDKDIVPLIRRILHHADMDECIRILTDEIHRHSTEELKRALALAYSATPERVEEGFWAMLDSKSEDTLEVLERDQVIGLRLLIRTIETERACELCELNETRFVEFILPLFNSNNQTLPESDLLSFDNVFPSLISQLYGRSQALQRTALKLLRRWNTVYGRRHASDEALCDLEVELCAKHDRPRLLELLRDSNGYSPDRALILCRSMLPELTRETVFLLQRLGGIKHSREALEMMIYELKDLDMALEYTERDKLFDELVRVCVSPNAPATLAADLLDKAGSYNIDPAQLIRALPSDRLPHVKQSVLKLLQDARANLRTQAVAKALFERSAISKAQENQKQFSRGLRIRASRHRCAFCRDLLVEGRSTLVAFRSGDVYHEPCLRLAWDTVFQNKARTTGAAEDVQSNDESNQMYENVLTYIKYIQKEPV